MSLALILALAAVASESAQRVAALEPADCPESARGAASAVDVSWLEPRGLNIVDLVGRVPEEHLQGAIISYTPGFGTLTYQSGSRIGTTVTITTTIFPRYFDSSTWSGSLFGCLGQPARIDQWGSVAPATTVRLYHHGREVTGEVDLHSYVPAGRNLPVRNPRESESQNRYRYWHKGEGSRLPTSFAPDGALYLPANMGCDLIISHRNYVQLTGVFTADVRPEVSVQVLGSQQFAFGSYLGPGYTGLLGDLVTQLRAKFDDRHYRLRLNIPPGADYFLLNFPMLPVDPFTQFPENTHGNIDRPSGGTYRVYGSGLSVDHVNTMGLPLYGHWVDSDRSSGEYLSYFQQPSQLEAPDYIIPDGVQYEPCMLSGTCPDSLLEQIWDTRMTLEIIYLRVERTAAGASGMDQIPLKMVGPEWHGPDGAAAAASSPDSAVPSVPPRGTVPVARTDGLTYRIYVPLSLNNYWGDLPPDVPDDRPQGWFAEDGRMLDFVPAVD